MLKGLKYVILQMFLVAVLLLYLFVPIHKELLTVLHSLSHKVETILTARAEHHKKHNHHFIATRNSHHLLSEQSHHVHNHDHTSTQQHTHNYIGLLASFFESAEHDNNKKDKHLSLFQFDKHIPSRIHQLEQTHILIIKEPFWNVVSCYHSIGISINLPPPKVS